MEKYIHTRMLTLFPFLSVNGWKYKGFGVKQLEGVGKIVRLRFEKAIRGRAAFVTISISKVAFDADDFKEWLITQVNEQESELIEQRRRQLDCVA